MLFKFNKRKYSTEANKSIFLVYGDNAMTVHTCQNWFARFRFKTGDFDLSNKVVLKCSTKKTK